ncbi:DNA recombination protein RmuC [Sulfurimonas aquatica]|uniref:DNA recombination protein RmuC n=1 Tax=Sulfurimonas aquatica TaxID=2672570 RepID=A0A975B1T3_9BACT|nr:DNA recombination protein RmuC [Sulfurimonas aquatica]QSZ42657.1 DNA recombination protein RmuC [Sulfurimonas aquatica]
MQFDLSMILMILGLSLFLVILYLYLREKDISKNLLISVEELNENNLNLADELEGIKSMKEALSLDNAVLKTRYESEIKSSNEKLNVLQNAKDELSKEFTLLANKIFEDKTKQFSNSNKEQLELLLKPFREQITNFSTQAKEQFHTQTKDTIQLKDELLRLKQMNMQLSHDAHNLTNALKGENKTQGNWGEIVLERILEQSGLRSGIEYELQATLKSNEGKTYRPDVVIHMPQERDIIIDSKVSLVGYERFINSEDPIDKSKALKEHILSISTHIKGLGEKKYEKLIGVNTLDFVLLFMPIEGAFLLALEQDGEFFKTAYENNILVVSPSTLLVTLRTIEHIWRTQRQEEHAKKIADEAEAMYEKLVGFVEEMKKVGTHLQKAQDSYDTSMNRLSTGRGNVIRRAENIVKLGIKPKKELSISSEDES